MNLRVALTRAIWSIFGSPNRDRLLGEIKQIRIELVHPDDENTSPAPQDPKKTEPVPPWKNIARRHLQHAEECMQDCRLQEGWSAAHAAQRTLVFGEADQPSLKRRAVVLWREVKTDKIGGWRAKAIADLICTDEEEIRDELTAEDVVAAIALRDDRLTTNYLRIDLRRRHLFNLFLIFVLALVALIYLAQTVGPPSTMPETRMLVLVIVLGALGASLSVAQGMVGADVDARIPAQLIGAFVVWMRPIIGAAAAVAVVVILRSGVIRFAGSGSVPVQLVFAIVAGYSERFLIGAIETVSEKFAKPADAHDGKNKSG